MHFRSPNPRHRASPLREKEQSLRVDYPASSPCQPWAYPMVLINFPELRIPRKRRRAEGRL
jgi:hypothetical protein